MPVWRMAGKPTYLRLQCKYMERYYNDEKLTPHQRKIMRANNICVKPSGRAIAFNEENEHFNLLLKRTPVTPSLNVAIWRDQDVIVGQKAAMELWHIPCRHSRFSGTSLEANIMELEELLLLSNVFASHE
jgi:hypothetical protein